MPYSTPSTITDPSRPAHRRARSAGHYFSDERGPGAFAPMGALPRRKVALKKQPVFHIRGQDDDDDDDDDEQDSFDSDDSVNATHDPALSPPPTLTIDSRRRSPPADAIPPRIQLPPQQQFGPAPEPAGSIPFPRSFPLSPTGDAMSIPIPFSAYESHRPALSRSGSTPIVLSNGKPLKSSLKSSASTPDIPLEHHPLHMRAQSAPSTPALTPKNVHFAEAGLESVRVFSRSAKPASLSKPPGDETETETEQESARYPFPRFSSPSGSSSPPAFEIDLTIPGATSTVPSLQPPPYANVHLESISLAPPHTAPVLTGTLLVRNVAYEKFVAVRFTLDDWMTTSEVSGRYVESLTSLPESLKKAEWSKITPGDAVGTLANRQQAQWDRFSFAIRLEDYAHKLQERVLWLVARYSSSGVGEWWDNNNGRDYRVGFRIRRPPQITARTNTVSAPAPLAIPNLLQLPDEKETGNPSPQVTAAPPAVSSRTPSATVTSSTVQGRRLSLSNYAAPSISVTAPVISPSNSSSSIQTPPMTPDDEHRRLSPLTISGLSTPTTFAPSPRAFPRSIIGGMPATAAGSQPGSGRSSPAGGAIGLHWPWAHTAPSAKGAGPGPPSPSGGGGGVNGPGAVAGAAHSDTLYNAFVKQWCFAQSPPPSPSVFHETPGGPGVLVG